MCSPEATPRRAAPAQTEATVAELPGGCLMLFRAAPGHLLRKQAIFWSHGWVGFRPCTTVEPFPAESER